MIRPDNSSSSSSSRKLLHSPPRHQAASLLSAVCPAVQQVQVHKEAMHETGLPATAAALTAQCASLSPAFEIRVLLHIHHQGGGHDVSSCADVMCSSNCCTRCMRQHRNAAQFFVSNKPRCRCDTHTNVSYDSMLLQQYNAHT
jgi:hypothetical protein